jgi:maltose O-acetyltransferase
MTARAEKVTFVNMTWHKIRQEILDRTWDALANGLLASRVVPSKVRVPILRLLGLKIGKARIQGRYFIGRGKVTIGYGVGVNVGAHFEPGAPIAIGDNVMIGPYVSLLTTTHPLGRTEEDRTVYFRTGGRKIQEPITIGDNVWLGIGATVLPGVSIGNGAVVGAHALVTRDVEPNTLVAGVPARKIRDLPV